MKIFTSFSIYALSSVINSAVSFFLLPVFTKYLAPEQYGQLGIFMATISLLTPVVGISSYGAIQAEYFKLKKDELASYIYTALLISFAVAVLITILSWPLSPVIVPKLGMSLAWIISIIWIVLFSIIGQIYLVLTQSQSKPINYAVFSLTQALLNIGLGLFFVVDLKWGWQGRGVSLLITSFFFGIVALTLLSFTGFLKPTYNKAFRKDLFRFGLPLIPHATGAFVLDFADRFFIKNLVNDHELGIYNVGYQIASILIFLDFAFIQVYTPVLYKYLSDNCEENKLIVRKVVNYYIVGFLISLILLSILAKYIIQIFLSKEYQNSSIYVFWIGLGYLFVSLYKIFAGFVFYFKETFFLLRLAIINIAFGLVTTYFLVAKYQTIGAAIATVLCFFVNWVLVLSFVYKKHKNVIFYLPT